MQPNSKLENLLDTLLPKGQETTITLSLTAFQKMVDKHFAMEAEINSKGEKQRVAQAEKEPQVAQGIPVEEKKVEKAKKGGK